MINAGYLDCKNFCVQKINASVGTFVSSGKELDYFFTNGKSIYCYTYEVIGDMNIDDFFAEVDFSKPEDFVCKYSTMGGWAVEMLDAEPHVGDSFRYVNLFIVVTEMEAECVTRLTVLIEPEEEEEKELE